ncbi:MAG: AbrB/MazE/SpoVT family DNA-binding domain-containing protein [Bifidobacteriaceae bacterium]|nr:AbrB/MazE/SpoVT family DNA-binding domain-containing protein [Bifidobacteriaceae bacterium]
MPVALSGNDLAMPADSHVWQIGHAGPKRTPVLVPSRANPTGAPSAPAEYRISISTNGRVVLPQPLRAARGWRDGDEILLIETGGGALIGSPAEILRSIQERFREPTSVTDEFIAERRAQAALEAPE